MGKGRIMAIREKYIRLKTGVIYGYTPLLEKRRDATVVNAEAAAAYYRAIGIKNELTEAYPDVLPGKAPVSKRKPVVPKENHNVMKAKKAEEDAVKKEKRKRQLDMIAGKALTPEPVPEPVIEPIPEPEPEPAPEPAPVLVIEEPTPEPDTPTVADDDDAELKSVMGRLFGNGENS